MAKKIVLVVLLLFAIVLNGDIFDRLFSTSKKKSISQAEVTVFAFHAIQNRYLNKAKLKPDELLIQALDNIQENFSEIVLSYKKDEKKVNIQIYNKTSVVEVKRMKDLWDIAIVLRQVYNYIEQEYKPEGDRDITDVEYVAINGILKKLDPHSYIFTPKEFEEFTSSTEGNFGGLGIVISTNEDGEIVVVSPMDGTPAEKAGVEAGDTIVQINDDSAINMNLQKAVEKMRGEPGTDITIYVKRKDVASLLKFTLTRAIIKIQSVISYMPAKGIGYVKLTGFMENSFPQLKAALDDLKKKGMKALVLDMRNNAGGLLAQAIKISDLFLEKGVIVSTVGGDEKEVSEAEKDSDDILDIPIAVIINEGSASATEIVTAALKKNNRATIVGRKTFGKGSVQNLFRIPGGGGLKLTIAQYLTPGDISIQSIGVVPDIEYVPSFVDKEKVSIFKNKTNMFLEKDLKEHIVSKYIPAKLDEPKLTINYFKPYKDPEKLYKESRKEKVGIFKNDEEIQITVDMLTSKLSKKDDMTAIASKIKEEQWYNIVEKLDKIGIKWKKAVSAKKLDPSNLKITLVSDPKLKAGQVNSLTFRATYPGEVENLESSLNTKIPYLSDLEIPFGSFTDSIERTVQVKLPESMPWRKETIEMTLASNNFDNVVKKEFIELETIPVDLADVKMTYLVDEMTGNINGLVEEKENVKVRVWLKNEGKGKLEEGRLLLINANNSHELFIKKGSEPVKLEPGEEKEVHFEFSVSTQEKDKASIKTAVSLYDYKTKYSAGFTIPFTKTATVVCAFKAGEKGALVKLAKGVKLYRNIEDKQSIADVTEDATAVIAGECGDMLKIEGGYWVKNSDAAKTTATSAVAQNLKTKNEYNIEMPDIEMDQSPLTVQASEYPISFKVKGDGIQDVFLFVNNKKAFYYRADPANVKKEFSVPLRLKEKTNRLTAVVKGRDAERIGTSNKFVLFPKGKDDEQEEE